MTTGRYAGAIEALADDVLYLRGRPRGLINAYLVGDVLVDAGTPLARLGCYEDSEGVPCARTP